MNRLALRADARVAIAAAPSRPRRGTAGMVRPSRRLAWLLALGVALALATLAMWWPAPRLHLADLAGTWRADAASIPQRHGLTAADAAELALWREAVVVIADGSISLRAGGHERTSTVAEGQAGADMLDVSGDGLAWTLHLHDGRLTVFTHTRAGSIPFTRQQP